MIRVCSTVEHLGKIKIPPPCQKILDTGLQNSMTSSTSKCIYMYLHYYKNGVKESGNNNHFLITHNQPFSINLWTLWTIVHCPCLVSTTKFAGTLTNPCVTPGPLAKHCDRSGLDSSTPAPISSTNSCSTWTWKPECDTGKSSYKMSNSYWPFEKMWVVLENFGFMKRWIKVKR